MTQAKAAAGLERFGIVIPVPPFVSRQLAPIRERFLQHRIHNPAHVTVVYPFASEREVATLCRAAESVCREFASFPVRLGAVASSPEARVVVLEIHDDGQLRRLHMRLLDGLRIEKDGESQFRFFERESYLPHVTLAADLSPEEFRQAWTELKDRRFREGFVVNELCLYRETGERHWEQLACFALGGQPGTGAKVL